MNEPFYPPLHERAVWAIEIILKAAAEDPEYLEDSPYSENDVRFLRELTGEVLLDETDDEGVAWDDLETQTKRLYRDLMREQNNLNVKDNAEKMSFFRTATQLLDKLVGIQERAANLKQIHAFHDTVMRVMDDILDAGQRTKVQEMLRRAVNPELSQ